MQKFIKLVLALFLVISLLPVSNVSAAKTFTDLTGYEEEIGFLAERGVINGYPDGTFKPKNNINRLNAIQMILREKGITDFTAPDPGFTDMHPGSYGYKEVAKAVELGIISGKIAEDGTRYFEPDGPVTRAHMAKILVEAYDLEMTDRDFEFRGLEDYWARDYINILGSNNIATGYRFGAFGPNNLLTRHHFAVFMARLLDDRFKKARYYEAHVHFIDVTQGDSILLEGARGETMLIDGGPPEAGDKVVAVLRSKGITELDYVVATNPDEDHIGGLITVLNNFPVKSFIDSGKADTTDTYLDLQQTIEAKGISPNTPEIGDTYEVGDFNVKVLYANPEASTNSDASIVLKAIHGENSYLLMSDADTKVEEFLLEQGEIKSTVLKAGNHGADTSSSFDFIQAVDPSDIILTYEGADPREYYYDDAVSRLFDFANWPTNIKVTSLWGNISFTTDGIDNRIHYDRWKGLGTTLPDPPEPNPER